MIGHLYHPHPRPPKDDGGASYYYGDKDDDVLNCQISNGDYPYGEMTFYDAYDLCSNSGLHLPIITSQAENDALYALIQDDSIDRGVWLGLSDADDEGEWYWVDGTSLDYENWNGGEPNGGTGENHGNIWKDNGGWNDNPATDGSLNVACCSDNLADARWEQCYDCRYCFSCEEHGTCDLSVEEKCWGQGDYPACQVYSKQCEWFDYEGEASHVGAPVLCCSTRARA